jgi:hypothetical protein
MLNEFGGQDFIIILPLDVIWVDEPFLYVGHIISDSHGFRVTGGYTKVGREGWQIGREIYVEEK